ncbi:hypothetical protein D0809_27985 [Flavobacterium circumlabens]|nr:hypothetical protein D0809_27985 [Flavobacterium circumlabens]
MKDIENQSKKSTKKRRLEIIRNNSVSNIKSKSTESSCIIEDISEDTFNPNAEPFKNIDYE